MNVYCVANLAGSAGKTTTATCCAVLLAQQGLRVRVIDLDSQANASTWLGYPDVDGITTADVLRRDRSIQDAERPARFLAGYTADEAEEMVWEDIPGLTIVPAARDTLDKLVVELSVTTGAVLNLRDALEEADPVDVTLIDSPGSLNVLVVSGILASSVYEEDSTTGGWGMITCTKPAGKENEGIPALERELARIKKAYRVDVPLLAIVPCAVPASGNVYREQLEDLIVAYGERVTPSIRRAAVVDEAYANYVPVPLYGYRAKPIIDDYTAVVGHMKQLGMFRSRATVA